MYQIDEKCEPFAYVQLYLLIEKHIHIIGLRAILIWSFNWRL